MRRARIGLIAALAAVSIAGCDSSDDGAQESWNPSDMYINARVEAANEVTARISVDFSKGYLIHPTHHLLTPGDVLSACVGAVCTPLTLESRAPGLISKTYVADLPYVAETAYTISLARQPRPA